MVKKIFILLIAIFAIGATAAQVHLSHRRQSFHPGGPSCTVATNEIAITMLDGWGATTNFGSYATASVNPAQDSMLLLFTAFSPVGTESVTNTGTLQLTWMKITNISYNTIASPAHELVLYASQMPPGQASFAMQVVLINSGGTGANMHLLQVTGADTNLLWGQNAIAQTSVVASNSMTNLVVSWAAPGNSGSNALIVAAADSVNNGTDNAPVGWTELDEDNYNTPAAGLMTSYFLKAGSGVTSMTNQGTGTTRNWGSIAVEIRAGTNNCGNGDWTFPEYGITRYVHTGVVGGTQNTPGGDGTTTNLTGATRAFNSIQDGILASFGSEPTALAVPWKFVLMGNYPDTGAVTQTTCNRVGTSYTNYFWLEVHPTWRHAGVFDTNKYWAAITNDSFIYNNGPNELTLSHFRVGWIQLLLSSSTGADYNGFRGSTLNVTNAGGVNAADIRFYNCIVQGTNTAGANNISAFRNSPYNGEANGGGKTRIWNCIAYHCETGFETDRDATMYVNCTSRWNVNGFIGTMITINCISANHSGVAGFNSTGNGGGFSRNNSTDDSSVPGYHSRLSQTFSFVGNLDLHLQAGDGGAKNFGFGWPLNILFTDDYEGQTRGANAWDIGGDEQQ